MEKDKFNVLEISHFFWYILNGTEQDRCRNKFRHLTNKQTNKIYHCLEKARACRKTIVLTFWVPVTLTFDLCS